MGRLAGIVIGSIGLLMGLFGLVMPGGGTQCFIAIALAIVGALFVAHAQRQDKQAEEQRRHEEMMAAIKQNKQS